MQGIHPKKKDVNHPKYIYVYISRTPKQDKNIHKAICASEIVILPSTKDNNSTTLPTWLIKTNMYDEYLQPVFLASQIHAGGGQ